MVIEVRFSGAYICLASAHAGPHECSDWGGNVDHHTGERKAILTNGASMLTLFHQFDVI